MEYEAMNISAALLGNIYAEYCSIHYNIRYSKYYNILYSLENTTHGDPTHAHAVPFLVSF